MTITELLDEFEFTQEYSVDGMIYHDHVTDQKAAITLFVAMGSRSDEIGVMLVGDESVVVSCYPVNDLQPSLVISFSRYEEATLRSILETVSWKGRG